MRASPDDYSGSVRRSARCRKLAPEARRKGAGLPPSRIKARGGKEACERERLGCDAESLACASRSGDWTTVVMEGTEEEGMNFGGF